MIDSDVRDNRKLVIRRLVPATRRRVFDAWTQASAMERWYGPGDVKATNVSSDARPGGTYRITMNMPDGASMTVAGTYLDVVPPERLSYTWSWEEDDPKDRVETLVTVVFEERGESTEVILTHERFASDESRANHERGWTTCLDQLEALAR